MSKDDTDSYLGIQSFRVQSDGMAELLVSKRLSLPSRAPFGVSEGSFAIGVALAASEVSLTPRNKPESEASGQAEADSSAGGDVSGSSSGGSTGGGGVLPLSASPVGNFYIYSFDGKLLQTYDAYGTLLKDYIYMGSRLVAEYDHAGARLLYYTPDQINSTRVVTDQGGNVVYSAAHDPYGEIQLTNPGNSYEPPLKFSGKERDQESELDYFGARYYDRSIFRFLSVDAVHSWSPRLYEPQLQNLYTYALDNPLAYLDIKGEFPVYITIVRTGLNPEGGVTGRFTVETSFASMSGYTLERPYLGYSLARTEGRQSAIEEGTYWGELVYDRQLKNGKIIDSIQLFGSALGKRTGILMHNGISIENTEGCILLGLNVNMEGARQAVLDFIRDSTICNVLEGLGSLPSMAMYPEITVVITHSMSYLYPAFLAWQKNSGILDYLFKKK